jgi:death-on-curing protein
VKAPIWVRRDAVVVIHEQLPAEFGGSAGIRDEGLLASALARSENRFAYRPSALFEVAASYGYGLAKNHSFVAGNKRTGFTVAILFLELNGCRFNAPEADAVVQTLALAASEIGEAEYGSWLEANSHKLRRR